MSLMFVFAKILYWVVQSYTQLLESQIFNIHIKNIRYYNLIKIQN